VLLVGTPAVPGACTSLHPHSTAATPQRTEPWTRAKLIVRPHYFIAGANS
jgi:hypothetical protein